MWAQAGQLFWGPLQATLWLHGGHRTLPRSLSNMGPRKRQFQRAKRGCWGAGICPFVTAGVMEALCPKSQAACVSPGGRVRPALHLTSSMLGMDVAATWLRLSPLSSCTEAWF